MGDFVPADHELENIGVGLGDEDTVNKLQFIERLQAIGVSKYIDLPQLVVVGDQNSGKSSVLQAITKLPFPVDDTLCTRFATEVSLRRAPGPESLEVSIKRHDGSEMETLEGAGLTNSPFGSSEFRTEFANILETASRQILGSQIKSQALSQVTLHITAQGPNQINLTVVDLPGLVSPTHRSYEDARNLVNRYINNPRSIVLLVAVPVDPDTQEVIQMLKSIPDKENRVIGVMNKCDRKQEGADNWILDALKNERRTNNQYYLSRGWYGLRNRLPSEINTTNDERDRAEEAFFQQGVWETLSQPTKLGIGNLRQALTKMHNAHIAKIIPELVPDIHRQLKKCELRLAQLGRARSTPREQRDCLVTLASDFMKLSTDALDGHYHNLPSTLSARVRRNVQVAMEMFKLDMEEDDDELDEGFTTTLLDSPNSRKWRRSILEVDVLKRIEGVIRDNRGREFSDEVNSNVMRVLWTYPTNIWEEKASATIDQMAIDLNEAIKILMAHATKDEKLQEKTTKWLQALLLDKTIQAAKEELKKLIEDEHYIWSLVPRYSELVGQLYSDMLLDMAKSLTGLKDITPPAHTTYHWKREITLWLSDNQHMDAVLRTYVRLRAYHEVAMARFIDNFGIQVVERHLLGRESPLKMFTPSNVLAMAEDDPHWLKEVAGENEEKTAERTAMNLEIDSLKEALLEARKYGFLQPTSSNLLTSAIPGELRVDESGALSLISD